MGGNRCVITGMGHHTTHSGKDWRFKSMSSEGEEDDARPAADRIATPRSDCVMESRLRNIGDQTFVATQSLGWTKDRIVKKRRDNSLTATALPGDSS